MTKKTKCAKATCECEIEIDGGIMEPPYCSVECEGGRPCGHPGCDCRDLNEESPG